MKKSRSPHKRHSSSLRTGEAPGSSLGRIMWVQNGANHPLRGLYEAVADCFKGQERVLPLVLMHSGAHFTSPVRCEQMEAITTSIDLGILRWTAQTENVCGECLSWMNFRWGSTRDGSVSNWPSEPLDWPQNYESNITSFSLYFSAMENFPFLSSYVVPFHNSTHYTWQVLMSPHS